MLRRLASLSLVIFIGVAVLAEPPVQVRAESFTLVGRVDGNRPSGTVLTSGDTLTLISDDSGAPTPYVIDLSWVLDKLPEAIKTPIIEI